MIIKITESQVKKLMLFQPGNEVSLNEQGDTTIKKGATGNDVTQLQQALINLKYSLPRYGVDGKFGNETESVVKTFQGDHGLTPNGW